LNFEFFMARRGSALQSFLDPAEEQISKTTKTRDRVSNSFVAEKSTAIGITLALSFPSALMFFHLLWDFSGKKACRDRAMPSCLQCTSAAVRERRVRRRHVPAHERRKSLHLERQSWPE
jgi:hypothetical protein